MYELQTNDHRIFKADIWKDAVLYLYEEYYFDVDLEILILVSTSLTMKVKHFPLPTNVRNAYFSQAFIALTSRHDIMKGTLKAILKSYSGVLNYRYINHRNHVLDIMGCIVLYYSYEYYVMKESNKNLLRWAWQIRWQECSKCKEFGFTEEHREGLWMQWLCYRFFKGESILFLVTCNGIWALWLRMSLDKILYLDSTPTWI